MELNLEFVLNRCYSYSQLLPKFPIQCSGIALSEE